MELRYVHKCMFYYYVLLFYTKKKECSLYNLQMIAIEYNTSISGWYIEIVWYYSILLWYKLQLYFHNECWLDEDGMDAGSVVGYVNGVGIHVEDFLF